MMNPAFVVPPRPTRTVAVGGVTFTVADGADVAVPVPTAERADELRRLYAAHVRPIQEGGDWRGPCHAVVPASLAPDVREAMDFVGATVDGAPQVLADGRVRLRSLGVWARGF